MVLNLVNREVSYGNSRFDIYFESHGKKGFIEVKGVTLEEDGIAKFPDAPTLRGTKHVLEMIKAVNEGYIGIIFFLIQMKESKEFRLNWKMDRSFSEAVKLASEKGVIIMAYNSIINENSIELGEPVKIDLSHQTIDLMAFISRSHHSIPVIYSQLILLHHSLHP